MLPVTGSTETVEKAGNRASGAGCSTRRKRLAPGAQSPWQVARQVYLAHRQIAWRQRRAAPTPGFSRARRAPFLSLWQPRFDRQSQRPAKLPIGASGEFPASTICANTAGRAHTWEWRVVGQGKSQIDPLAPVLGLPDPAARRAQGRGARQETGKGHGWSALPGYRFDGTRRPQPHPARTGFQQAAGT